MKRRGSSRAYIVPDDGKKTTSKKGGDDEEQAAVQDEAEAEAAGARVLDQAAAATDSDPDGKAMVNQLLWSLSTARQALSSVASF